MELKTGLPFCPTSSTSCLLWTLVFLLLTMANSGQGQYDDMDITVDVPSPLVHVGDNTTVVCRIQPTSPGALIYIKKMVIGQDGTEYMEDIAINTFIVPAYQHTGRYLVRANFAGEAALFFLYINNFQPEDSGAIVCSGPEDKPKAAASVEVYKQPEKLAFQRYSEGETIHFDEGVGKEITCEAFHASPRPTLSLRVGSHTESTSGFTIDGATHVLCPPGSEEKETEQCLLSVDYDATFTDSDFVPYYQYDEGSLVCVADFGEESGLEPMETSLKLEIHYGPKFDDSCPEMIHAKEGEYNVFIECLVRFNPAPEEKGDIVWSTVTSDGRNHTLSPRDTNHEGFTAGKEIQDSKSWLITLAIDKVYSKYSNQFDLTVRNRIGEARHSLQFVVDAVDDPGSVVGGGASTTSISTASLLAAAILARACRHL